MIRALLLALLVLAPAGLHAQTRIAGVRVTDAFQACTQAKHALDAIEQRRKALADDPRHKEIDAMVAEIRKLQEKLAPQNDPQVRDDAARQIEIKRGELESTGRLIEEDRVKAERQLNRELFEATREALDLIRQTAAKVGKERGFDLVVDSSGNSNTGLSFLLYSKELPDLTADVIALLNQGQPEPPPAGAPPADTAPPAEPAPAQDP